MSRRPFAAVAILLSLVLSGLGLLAAPMSALAAPYTFTDPVSGASITLSSTVVAPGERIQISGTGFVAAQGSVGETLVAVRPYDYDPPPAWTAGGEDHYDPVARGNPTAASEAAHWFVTDHTDNGSFTGWIQVPATATTQGPFETGQHWLRFLSGAFFSTTGDRLTSAITFTVPLTVVAGLATGSTSPTGILQPGDTFRPGGQITLTGRGFEPSTVLEVSLGGVTLVTTVSTDVGGAVPTNTRVTVPAGTTPGTYPLRVTTGAVTRTVDVRVMAAPTAAVLTPRLQPGAPLAYRLTGYLGVAGAPQKVGIVVSEQVLACIQTDAAGNAAGQVTLPAGATGDVVVGFNVGTSCQLPPAVINDQPIGRIAPTVRISTDAPALAAIAEVESGSRASIDATGFASGAGVTVIIGEEETTLTADASGRVVGSATVPLAAGDNPVLVSDGTDGAAGSVRVVAVPPRSMTAVRATTATGAYGKASTTLTLTAAGTAAAGPVRLSVGGRTRAVQVGVKGTRVPLAWLGAGRHVATVSFAGDAGRAPSSSRTTLVVAKAKAVLKSTWKPRAGRKVALAFSLRVAGADTAKLGGTVTVLDGRRTLERITVRTGSKQLVLGPLARGRHALRLVYSGDKNVTSLRGPVKVLRVR